MGYDLLHDEAFLNEVAPDVLGVLTKDCFFERLDDRFSPVDASKEPAQCSGSFAISTEILGGLGFDAQEIREIMAVLRWRGGCCDCEILFNVAEKSRLRAKHWKARARGEFPRLRHAGPRPN